MPSTFIYNVAMEACTKVGDLAGVLGTSPPPPTHPPTHQPIESSSSFKPSFFPPPTQYSSAFKPPRSPPPHPPPPTHPPTHSSQASRDACKGPRWNSTWSPATPFSMLLLSVASGMKPFPSSNGTSYPPTHPTTTCTFFSPFPKLIHPPTHPPNHSMPSLYGVRPNLVSFNTALKACVAGRYVPPSHPPFFPCIQHSSSLKRPSPPVPTHPSIQHSSSFKPPYFLLPPTHPPTPPSPPGAGERLLFFLTT